MSIFLHHVLYIICSKAKIPHTDTKITQFRLLVGGGGEEDGYTKKKKTQ